LKHLKHSIYAAVTAGLMITGSSYSQNANAASRHENACAIWICLPVGFGVSGCGGARKEFLRRIRKGKSPLVSLSSCSGGNNNATYSTGFESHESCPTGYTQRDYCNDGEGSYNGSSCRTWGRYGGEFRGGSDYRTCTDYSRCSYLGGGEDRFRNNNISFRDGDERFRDGDENCPTVSAPTKDEPYWIEYSIDGGEPQRYYFNMQ